MALVSVVVRTKNRVFFLERALSSIAGQRDAELEAVVVNDGGAPAEVDAVAARARAGGLNVRVVHHTVSRGRGAAWNAGWREARGEWLAALDDDDTWAPDFLSAVRAEISAGGGRTDFGIATQTLEIREKASGAAWIEVASVPFNPRFQVLRLRDLVLLNRFTNNAFVFPRAALAEVGEVREELDVLEDWDFNVRFAARYPIRVIARPLAHYRRRPGGGDEAWANTDSVRHEAARDAIREAWLREDLQAGRFGPGVLALMAEIESNRGLRLFNRIASWFGR